MKPQEISLKQLVQEPLVVGQTVSFECITHGSRPQATIHWLFQGVRHDTPMNGKQTDDPLRRLTQPKKSSPLTVNNMSSNYAKTTVDQQQTSSRLTLTLQRSFNQQTLTCVAENPRISSSNSIQQSLKLDVHCEYSCRIN